LAQRGGGQVTVAEGLLGPFRVLAGGQDLEAEGAALLEQACRAFGAAEGAVLLAEEAFAPGPGWGAPGRDGRLGSRRGDRELVADAVAAGRPLAAGPAAREAWCAMAVEGRTVGVLALRRDGGPPFTGGQQAAVELLATAAAVAVDRLRFLRLWSRKLDQADAAHSQLLRYADDLRTTFTAERRRAEQLREALDAVQLAYIATVRALATAVEAKDAYTGGHLTRVTAYGIEACRALGSARPPTRSWRPPGASPG
jgi:GAF domain-containing protein